MNDFLVKQSEALTNYQQWATAFAAEATKALGPRKTRTIRGLLQPSRNQGDAVFESFSSSGNL